MITAAQPETRKSVDEMYEVDNKIYKRFDSSKEGFVTLTQKLSGKPVRGIMDIAGFLNESWAPTMMKGMQANTPGKSRTDYALDFGAAAVNYILGAYGDQNANQQFLKWNPLFVPEPLTKLRTETDPDKLTPLIKYAAKVYGACLVGITELDQRWVYEGDVIHRFIFDEVEQPIERGGGILVIPKSVNRAVVIAVEMNKELILQAPGARAAAATDLGYALMGFVSISLAECIRGLGYNAIPCMNDTALSIPLAISAGLGQLGRHGMLITPDYGPCLRLAKVLTDMPLNTDKPVDFGVTEFCNQCLVCAKACPANAITFGDRTMKGYNENNNPGVKKWYIQAEKCLKFWIDNGSPCAVCVAVCPYTEGFDSAARQCLLCERCLAPECPIQSLPTHPRGNGKRK
jgi:reductive dehalogenase